MGKLGKRLLVQLEQELATFSVKGWKANIASFASHRVSTAAPQRGLHG